MTLTRGLTTANVVAPYISGLSELDLVDNQWLNAEPVFIRHYWTGEVAPVERHAEVRLCWNDLALVARFVCSQKEPLIVNENPVTDKKTIGLWSRDVCEIFIAPNKGNLNHYYEFEAAPTGEWIDLGIEITASGRTTDWDYSSGMSTRAKIEPDKIIITIGIPWGSDIPRPRRGSEWGINLFRCVGSDEATRYLAWRPTKSSQPNFHVPEAFGRLRFG